MAGRHAAGPEAVTLGRVFVDTGAWFALQVIDDEHHPVTRETLLVLLDASRALVTSITRPRVRLCPGPHARGAGAIGARRHE